MRFRCASCFALALALLAGCAGSHLYDPAKAELARQGKETIDSLDFSAFMAAEDANVAAYQQEETKAWRDNVRLTRDLALADLAASSLPLRRAWLLSPSQLGRHFDELFAVPVDIEDLGAVAEDANRRKEAYDSTLEGVRERREIYASLGLSPPACEPSRGVSVVPRTPDITATVTKDAQAQAIGPETVQVVLETYDDLVRLCDEAGDSLQAMANLTPQTRKIGEDILAMRSKLKVYEAEQQAIAAKFDSIVAQIEAAAPNAAARKPSELVGPALEALREIASKGAEFAGSAENLEIAKKRLERIDAVLSAAASGELEDPALNQDRRRLAVALGGLPDLADSFYDLAASTDDVPRLALLVIREQVRAQRDLAAADLARRRGKVQILEAQLQTLIWELSQYSKSARLIDQAAERVETPDLMGRPPAELLSGSAPASVRERVKAAVAWSVYVWSEAERRLGDLEAASNALDYEAKQARSRVALVEWKGMLSALADGQAAYHETGIRPEELSALAIQLLQAAGLFTIAAGVH